MPHRLALLSFNLMCLVACGTKTAVGVANNVAACASLSAGATFSGDAVDAHSECATKTAGKWSQYMENVTDTNVVVTCDVDGSSVPQSQSAFDALEVKDSRTTSNTDYVSLSGCISASTQYAFSGGSTKLQYVWVKNP